MRPSRNQRLVALGCCSALLTTVPGCSFVLVQGRPPTPPASGGVECTAQVTAPVVDTILAAAGAGLAIYGGVTYKPCNFLCTDHDVGLAALISGVTTAVLFGASAYYGYWKTAQCRSASACTAGDDGACERVGWPAQRVPPPRE